jgi:hypothetical protein
MFVDTMDKIVHYFYGLTTKSFIYKGRKYDPKPLYISPLLLRGYTCPDHCAGCCLKFSLDYLPFEQTPDEN